MLRQACGDATGLQGRVAAPAHTSHRLASQVVCALVARCRAQIEGMDNREGGATSARAQQLIAPSPIPLRVFFAKFRAQIEAMDYREGAITSARAQQLPAHPVRVFTERCGAQIGAMDYREGGATSARAQQLTAALDDADRFAPPEAALQTRQLLGAIRCASTLTLSRRT